MIKRLVLRITWLSSEWGLAHSDSTDVWTSAVCSNGSIGPIHFCFSSLLSTPHKLQGSGHSQLSQVQAHHALFSEIQTFLAHVCLQHDWVASAHPRGHLFAESPSRSPCWGQMPAPSCFQTHHTVNSPFLVPLLLTRWFPFKLRKCIVRLVSCAVKETVKTG